MAQPGALTRRARFALPILILLLVLFSWHRLRQPAPPGERPFVALSGQTMGTTWSVKLATAEFSPADARAAKAAITGRLDRVNALMSTWREDSELSRLNRHAAATPFPLSSQTVRVLEISREVSEATSGAFDVTVGPLVRAWGFGAGAALTPPAAGELEALRERVGFRKLTLEPAAARKLRSDLTVDLSAVAKGYGVDQIAEALSGLGHENFLAEIGGELRARGGHLDGSSFRVAIEEPREEGRAIHRVVALRDAAMATSGDYRNVYELEGRRVAHIIDPRTGRPAEHGLASVSVVHEEAAWADAWATALQVLGPQAGLATATERGLAAYFIERSPDGRFTTAMTPAFEPWLAR